MSTYTINVSTSGLSPASTTVNGDRYARLRLVNDCGANIRYTLRPTGGTGGLATTIAGGRAAIESMPGVDSELELIVPAGVFKVTFKVSSSPTPGPGIAGGPDLDEDDEPVDPGTLEG